MELKDLTPDELLVLMGLVKLVVHADQEVSSEEREVLATLQRQVGPEAWNQAVRAARDAFPTVEALEVQARQVQRPEAQHTMHAVLLRLAGSDEIIDEEAHVLQWVVDEWGLVENEPEAVEDFVMLDGD